MLQVRRVHVDWMIIQCSRHGTPERPDGRTCIAVTSAAGGGYVVSPMVLLGPAQNTLPLPVWMAHRPSSNAYTALI